MTKPVLLLVAALSAAWLPARGQATLGVSYAQALGSISDVSMRASGFVRGLPRWVGTSTDGLTVVDFVGDKRNLAMVNVSTGVRFADFRRRGQPKLAAV